jgi:hypothetical protein
MRFYDFISAYRRPLGLALFVAGAWWLGNTIDAHLGGGAACLFVLYLAITAAVAYGFGVSQRQRAHTKTPNNKKTAPTPAGGETMDLRAEVQRLTHELASERELTSAMTEELSPESFESS